MYKTTSGTRKFSLSRFISNAVPNVAGPPQDVKLIPHEQDLLFVNQLNEPDPLVLAPLAFQHAGVTSNAKTSTAIHKALLKNGVLHTDSSTISTDKITRKFAHELSSITSHAQKKLVDMLFFWEEEVQRRKVLMGELSDLEIVLAAERETCLSLTKYEKKLAELQDLLRLKPSLRGGEREGTGGVTCL